MIDWVEAVKFLGGLAGLGTAGFTIYDRLLRSRPIVSICAAEHYGEGAAYLRVKNRSEFDIVLTAIDASRPTRVSLRDDRVSVVKSALGMTQYRALAPGETAHLDVTLPHDFRESLERSSDDIRFTVRWHRAAGPTWLGGWPLTASIRAQDLHHILEDAALRRVPSPAGTITPI